MNILLLGDCIAVGQNLLMPEITNNKDIRVPEFNVNKQFEKEIVKWFGYKPKLSLLYRVSDDGDSSAKFWEKCENKENTITFVSSKEGKRFGGYREMKF